MFTVTGNASSISGDTWGRIIVPHMAFGTKRAISVLRVAEIVFQVHYDFTKKGAAMPPAARVTDMHTCPMTDGPVPHVGGPILPPGCVTVLIGGLPAARITDQATCTGPPDVIVRGSATVLIGDLPAARMGDQTAHGGVIVFGWPTVIIGD
jgi:uncharacterized Zn-binding protein involved in type VI secretion